MKQILILFALFFNSCITSSKSTVKLLRGEWCTYTNKINYPKIQLGANYRATLMSRADTIYGYRYYVKDNRLAIVIRPDTVYQQILKLTRDSLVLDGLLENKELQRYFRCNLLRRNH